MSNGPRAALYARFSTDLQNDRSIDDQLDLCRRHAAGQGLTVTRTYADRAASSASIIGREGLLAMMADAQAGAFDAVIVESLDRLSRDTEHLSGIHKRLTFRGVRIVTVHEGTADRITVGLRGLMGEIFLADLRDKTRRGLSGVIRDGRSAGGRCYGYAAVPGRPGELRIVEAEADVIRRIFAEYARGNTPREIVARLNAEGIAPPRGTIWRPSTLNGNPRRGYGLLWNDLYRGERVWNRVTMVLDPETGRRISRTNPEDLWQRHPAPHLRIVADDLFEAVRARRHSRKHQGAGRRQARPARPFSGLMTCGACGGNMTVQAVRRTAVYCGCVNVREAGTCTQPQMVRLDHIETAIFDRLAELLASDELLKVYVAEYRAEMQRLARTAPDRIEDLRRKATAARQSFDRARTLYETGVADGPEDIAHLRALRLARDTTTAELEAAIATADAGAQVARLHPDAPRRYRSALEDLRAAIADGPSTPANSATVEALRDLVSGLTVDVTEGTTSVTVYGSLAAAAGLFEKNGSVRASTPFSNGVLMRVAL